MEDAGSDLASEIHGLQRELIRIHESVIFTNVHESVNSRNLAFLLRRSQESIGEHQEEYRDFSKGLRIYQRHIHNPPVVFFPRSNPGDSLFPEPWYPDNTPVQMYNWTVELSSLFRLTPKFPTVEGHIDQINKTLNELLLEGSDISSLASRICDREFCHSLFSCFPSLRESLNRIVEIVSAFTRIQPEKLHGIEITRGRIAKVVNKVPRTIKNWEDRGFTPTGAKWPEGRREGNTILYPLEKVWPAILALLPNRDPAKDKLLLAELLEQKQG